MSFSNEHTAAVTGKVNLLSLQSIVERHPDAVIEKEFFSGDGQMAQNQSARPVRAAGRAAAIFCAENPAHVPEAGLLQERNIGCPMEFKNNSDRDGSVAKDFFAHQDFKDEPTLAAAADCEVWE
jgi:hypothetical protein